MKLAIIITLTLLQTYVYSQNYQTTTNTYDKDDINYDKLLKEYKKGRRSDSLVSYLVVKSKQNGDTRLSEKIAQDYINNHLLLLSEKELFTKQHISFIKDGLKSSKDKSFTLVVQQSDKINKTMNSDAYAQRLVDNIVTKEEINKYLIEANDERKEPDWNEIKMIVNQKYEKNTAERTILDAQIRWYAYKKNWPTYCIALLNRVNEYGPTGLFLEKSWQWNSCAWDMFERSENKNQLKVALKWSEEAIKTSKTPNAQYYDTYANLFYKIGDTKKALALQKKALDLDPNSPDIRENLEKMKAGIQTWPAN